MDQVVEGVLLGEEVAEGRVAGVRRLMDATATDGQRLLHAMGRDIMIISDCSTTPLLPEASNYAHGMAIASSRHETQYSRIFRS